MLMKGLIQSVGMEIVPLILPPAKREGMTMLLWQKGKLIVVYYHQRTLWWTQDWK